LQIDLNCYVMLFGSTGIELVILSLEFIETVM
jgi:hypothetical protein